MKKFNMLKKCNSIIIDKQAMILLLENLRGKIEINEGLKFCMEIQMENDFTRTLLPDGK